MDEATTRVTVDKQAGNWRVTLNHPPINTVDDLMYDEIFDLVQAIDAEPALKLVTFESAKGDYFLAHYGVGESQSRFGKPRWRDAAVQLDKSNVLSIAVVWVAVSQPEPSMNPGWFTCCAIAGPLHCR